MLIFLILLPVSILILNIWLWLFNNIFEFKDNKLKILGLTIIMGAISGLSIILYPKLLSILNLANLDFTIDPGENFAQKINYFCLYLLIIVLISKFILFKFKFSKLFLINLGIFAILVIIFNLSEKYLIFGIMANYYIFVAFGEEMIKFFLGINFYEKFKITKNDIIIFTILSSLGFAFVENIVYMLGGLSGNGFLIGLIGSTSILLTRGIVGFMVHILFTGNMGFFAMKGLEKKLIMFSIIGISIGLIMHYLYDILLFNNYKIIILIYLIFGYFWISYLFYRSDRLYLKQGMYNFSN